MEEQIKVKVCPVCQGDVGKRKKFCSLSCAVSFNNRGVVRRGKPKFCVVCGKKTERHNARFCGGECHVEWKYNQYIKEWLNGTKDGGICKGEVVSKHVRRYMCSQSMGKCAICEKNEWMGKPMPLVLDHVDGNPTNHRPENLRMVCGNCDMQLPTYKNKNKGRGRFSRRERFARGKSF
jgi:hypothetical protein